MGAADAALTSFDISNLGLTGFACTIKSCNKTFYVYEFFRVHVRSHAIVQLEHPRLIQGPLMGLLAYNRSTTLPEHGGLPLFRAPNT